MRPPRAIVPSIAALALVAGAAPAAGAGFAWSAPQTVVQNTAGPPFLAVTDASGNTVAATNRPARQGGLGLLQRAPGGDWSAPATVSTPNRTTAQPDLAAAGDGAAAVVWIEGYQVKARSIRAATREPGSAFGPGGAVSARGRVNGPRVAVDARGDALVVWVAGERYGQSTGQVMAAYRPAGGAFGPARSVSSAGARFARVAMSADGHAVVAWTRGADVEAIHADGGAFGHARRIGLISRGQVEQAPPAVAVGPEGGAVIAWAGAVASPLAPGADPVLSRPTARVVRAALRAPGGHFARASVIRSVPGQNPIGLNQVTAAAGPGGSAMVAWAEGDLVNSLRVWGAYAAPGGRFGAPAAVSPEQDGLVASPAVSFAPDGTLAAAWGWYAAADRSGLQVARGAEGSFGPPATVSGPVPLYWGVRDEMRPQLSIDGRGAATVAWTQQVPMDIDGVTHYGSDAQVATGLPAD